MLKRDWGHAKDYVDHVENVTTKKPEDYIIATGKQYAQ